MADARYAADRSELIRAYHLLKKDFIHLCNYIEPADENLSTYSHRTYELFLRCCTEFEAICKTILIANDYGANPKYLNVKDFYKLNSAMRLNEYSVYVRNWRKGLFKVDPFEEWKEINRLGWYQDYNEVKHNRHSSFQKASFHNAIKSLGAVFCLLAAQFHLGIFFDLQLGMSYYEDEDINAFSSGTLFKVVFPKSWSKDELYDFTWAELQKLPHPFVSFPFEENL